MNDDDKSKHHMDHEGGPMDHSAHENDNPGGVTGDGESKSDVTDGSSQLTSRADCDTPESSVSVLAWQRGGGRSVSGSAADLSQTVRPGEYVMRSLFADFTSQAEKKLDQVLAEPQEKPLSKVLQRGEDPAFDQLLTAFGCVAEHCLPSILRALFAWYERQMRPAEPVTGQDAAKKTPENRGKGLFSGEPVETKEAETIVQERRDLAVEFVFCLILIEVLKQLSFHPGHEHLVTYIETVAFKHFKYREGIQNDPNATNVHTVADLYAEVIGVLAQSRFQSVRKRFTSELKELRAKEPNTHTTQSIISLLMGMKFFRVKMVPIEEFEASFQFMQECATYFTELKDKDIKHALAGLFVEILVPVAATVKNEVNVPCVKNFVESLYGSCLDMCTKSKHRLALFPLVTCLLCVSQKTFFLANWHYFLALCLSHLKNSRDPKISRVALESLYRLLWVYMIRIKCESNSATQSRLQSIVNSLFPKGSKAVVPRDTPLNIFVKIIQFIAQERLDFAMREIVFDLLSVGRPIKLILTPERMSIGLRAFLVVADSLQQKEGEPPMPRTSGVLPSGNTLLRVKKTYLNKMLTEDTARSIGISAYFPHVRRVFVDILRALDIHYGRPLMMTSTQNVNKEPDEMITGERKPRIDLFRTCVAAVPRLIPEAMTRSELVDLLARLTTHMDEELRGLAYQSLQTLVIDFPDWRHDVIAGFTQFLAREVLDTFPQLVDNGLRMLLQLLTSWRNALTQTSASSLPGSLSRNKEAANQKKTEASSLSSLTRSQVFHQVEGFALVMLCNVRLTPRRLSVHILREIKLLNKATPGIPDHADQNVIDVIDKACPDVLEQCMPQLTCTDKTAALTASCIDLQWIADRSASVWTAGIHDECTRSNASGSLLNLSPSGCPTASAPDPWGFCLVQFLQKGRLLSHCPAALNHAWPIVYVRLHTLFPVIDPTPVSDNRASLLRSSAAPRKPPASEAARDAHLALWRYLSLLAARVVPPVPCPAAPRCASPDLSLTWGETSLGAGQGGTGPATLGERPAGGVGTQPPPSPTGLYKLLVPLLRCETTDVRDAAVHALGNINAEAVKDLMEEMVVYIREAVDRKTENMRRRRRRDALRLQLVRVFELIASHGTFGSHSASPSLLSPLAEYVDGARLCLELEADKQILREIKAHFCNFVCKMIHSFPLESRQSLLKRDLRRNLFSLFTSWAGPYGRNLNITQVYSVSVPNPPSNPGPETLTTSEEELQLTSLSAMSAVLTCGPCFDPSTLLAEDGILYPWLDMLLASAEDKTYQIGCQTVILLLECNPDMGPLLDWVVDRCYTASAQVADGCFLALATIFSTREYPCDHYTAIINVALMNTGCPRTHIHETALQLLHLLDKRFFGTVDLLAPGPDGVNFETGSGNERHVDAALLSNTYCRSQMHLSEQMSQLHPELTMPMFSEITHRFQTARPEVRQILLQYLLPWLHNMELLDPNVPPANPLSYYQYCSNDVTRPGCRREGWGSVEATEMVLNNLFYITAKFADELPKEIEDVWATLCSCWPNNLKVIIRYLIIMSGMAPNQLLVYAKRVILYVARARPDRLLDEMVVELQTVETLSWLIERTETPPFYRLTSMRKPSNHSDLASDPPPLGALPSAPGTIHTKRHSAESESVRNGGTCKSDSAAVRNSKFVPPRGSDKIRTASGPAIMSEEMFTPPDMEMLCNPDENHLADGTLSGTQAHNLDILQPHPLPMPEYGGYFAPLTEYLPEGNQPSSGFHRCNVAIMLLTDLVVAPIELDWTAHLPLTLHILFLGLDHPRTTVLDHCKHLLLNLLLVLCAPGPWHQLTVAQILLNTNTRQLLLGLATPPTQVTPRNFTDPDSEIDLYQSAPADHPASTPTFSKADAPPLIVVPEDEVASTKPPLSIEVKNMDIQHVLISLIDFLSSKHNQVLWAYEDITAKVWSVRSAEQLDVFLRHVLRLFRESLPHALISERWAQTALQLGLSCGSRHYAGRSLQIFRALRVPINSRMLTDILSRLVETVAETGEDMQGYVTELLLTLEAAVDALESDFRPLDHMKELFKSTPNLNNKEPGGGASSGKRSPGLNMQGGMMGQCSHMTGVHARSTSYSISYCTRKTANCAANLDSKGAELRARTGGAGPGDSVESRQGAGSVSPGARHSPSLARSRSAQSLKLLGEAGSADDKLTILAQAFWLAVSLLESDYEHEYLLGLRLLARVLSRLPLDRPDARDKVDKLQIQLKPSGSWPGVHSLLLKGCTNPNTYEAVVPLLSQFTPLLEFPVVDATQSVAFPMNVVALLPYMLLHYEDANELCIMSAENIAQLSAEKSKKLENLGTVMTLYSRRTFSKESFQWTKCVVKYLYDSYSHLSMTMLTFLVEVLEKGPPQMQLPVLNIIHCMLHYVDLNSSSHFNSELLRVIGKHIEGPNYKEALFILKLVVTRSSTLVTPPQLHHQYINWESHTASSSHSSFTEFKKELPGRTMEFTVDLSQTPVIGRKAVKPATSESEVPPASPRRSVSLSPGDGINITGWKRPWMSQSRVRDCLVNVLTTCGQRVGLPKSPSVIFSQSSDLLERQSSMASSTEEVSGPDLSGGTTTRPNAHREPADQFGVFKDFDFLEYESESVEGESTDNFNWGVRRRPLSEGDENPEPTPSSRSLQEESTPLLTARKLGTGVIEESSDDEIGSESPLDEIPPVPEFSNTSGGHHHHHHHHHHQPSSLNIRPRTTSDPRSDTSGSSTGDISELTPCNTSPNLAFRPILREDTEELFRLHIQSLLQQTPPSSLHLFHTLHRLIKDIVRKTVTLTRDATHNLTELGTLASPLTSYFTSLTDSLAGLAAQVPLVYFNPEAINLPPEPLKFGLLQMKEHTDTLLDRNDQAAECVDALRAVLKLQTLGEEASGGGRSHQEPIVEAGRSLYKLYFQLMLLLESANKMIALVVDNARNNHLQDVSSEVILMRKSLVKAQEDIGIATPTPTPPPALGDSETEGVILDYLAQARWSDALIFTRTHRNACLSEAMLPSTSEDDDVTNLISLYCQQVLREKPDAYIVTDRDLGQVLTHLMEGLMQVLTAVSSIEANLSPATTASSSKHSSHLSTRC